MSGSTLRLLCVALSAAVLFSASPAVAGAPPLPPGLEGDKKKPADKKDRKKKGPEDNVK